MGNKRKVRKQSIEMQRIKAVYGDNSLLEWFGLIVFMLGSNFLDLTITTIGGAIIVCGMFWKAIRNLIKVFSKDLGKATKK